MEGNFIDTVAAKAEPHRIRNPGDYNGEDGLLRCGVCGEKKETIIFMPGYNGNKIRRTVGCACKCARDQAKELEEQDRRKEREILSRRMKEESLMDRRFFNADFSAGTRTKYNEKNFAMCERYVSRFETMVSKNQGLLFWGDIGTGKSFAAACIANRLIEEGIPVIMTSFVKVMEMIKGNEQEEYMISLIRNVKLAIFDDMGAERNTDYALEKVYNIIDSRYRANLPMIITTNLTLDEMLNEGDIRYKRIYDRIFEVCYPVHWTGPSWRKTQAKDRFDEMGKLLEV